MNVRALRARHFGAEEVDLTDVRFTPDLLASVPAVLARQFRVVPIRYSSGKLVLALADPSDIEAIDSLGRLLQRELELCVADDRQLTEFIERLYGLDARD